MHYGLDFPFLFRKQFEKIGSEFINTEAVDFQTTLLCEKESLWHLNWDISQIFNIDKSSKLKPNLSWAS